MKAEEAKLKAKYPGLAQRPGGSDFLMKRLQKGVGAVPGPEGPESRSRRAAGPPDGRSGARSEVTLLLFLF